ncbi:MAG: YqgE/AlgH family protein [Planctomycetota bacterium]
MAARKLSSRPFGAPVAYRFYVANAQLPTWQSNSFSLVLSMDQLLTGQLLVASSTVSSPIYAGGVCLVVHEDADNVIGVMLNRPMQPNPQMLMDLMKQAGGGDDPEAGRLSRLTDSSFQTSSSTEDASPQEKSPLNSSPLDTSPLGMLHFGGPQSGPVVAIHQDVKLAEAETGEGIYVAAQKHHLEDLVRAKQSPYRLIIGHLNWQREQLNEEMQAGLWHQTEATRQAVFASPDLMWAQVVRRATAHSLAGWLRVPDVERAWEVN